MRILFLFFAVFSFHFLTAQTNVVLVSGVAPNNYIIHKVVPKENWFSVGRLYNVNAKELAKFNKLTVEKGLSIDQIIKIPFVESNKYNPSVTLTAGEVTVPLYHNVEKSEGLYRIALNNGVTMQQLRDWNTLTSDNLTTGSNIKVGFIRVKESESALANYKEALIVTPNKVEDKPIEIVKDSPKVVEVKEPTKPVEVKVATKEPIEPNKKTETKAVENKTGNSESFYKADFLKQNKSNYKELDGKSATFKTMAGWGDNKFYALIDGVPSGNIIQITNKSNGKVIYAKILGEMQELKQNHGLTIRISNAAASALDANEEVFDVTVKY